MRAPENLEVTRANLSGDFRNDLFSALPSAAEILRNAGPALEAECRQSPVLIGEAGCQNCAVLGKLAVQVLFLHDHPEGVAGLQLGVEIDIPHENLGKIESEPLFFPCIGHSREERTPDHAVDRFHAGNKREILHHGHVPVTVAIDGEVSFVVEWIPERTEIVIGSDVEPVWPAGDDPGKVIHRPGVIHQPQHLLPCQSMPEKRIRDIPVGREFADNGLQLRQNRAPRAAWQSWQVAWHG